MSEIGVALEAGDRPAAGPDRRAGLGRIFTRLAEESDLVLGLGERVVEPAEREGQDRVVGTLSLGEQGQPG